MQLTEFAPKWQHCRFGFHETNIIAGSVYTKMTAHAGSVAPKRIVVRFAQKRQHCGFSFDQNDSIVGSVSTTITVFVGYVRTKTTAFRAISFARNWQHWGSGLHEIDNIAGSVSTNLTASWVWLHLPTKGIVSDQFSLDSFEGSTTRCFYI